MKTIDEVKFITKNPGIYYLKIKDANYVGSSVSLKTRVQEHLSKLVCGKHENPRMQNTFNKHGKENFFFSVLESFDGIDKIELLEKEKCWIEMLGPVLNNKLDPTTQTNSTSQSKKVYQFDTQGRLLTSYPSCKEASRRTFISASSITQNCNKKLLSAGGYLWSYDEKAKLSYDLERSKWKWKAVKMVIIETGEELVFDNISKAAKHVLTSDMKYDSVCATISSICKGKGKTLQNKYTFCYME